VLQLKNPVPDEIPAPPGAGKIKISTIIPDSLPWTGVYFDGNPVRNAEGILKQGKVVKQ
jgi:hypothetical protein